MNKQVNLRTHLGLLLSTVRALAIPPGRAVSINDVATSTVDLDVGSGNRDQRAFPLLVCESCLALEGDLDIMSLHLRFRSEFIVQSFQTSTL